MTFQLFASGPNRKSRRWYPAPPVRPLLEPLEDRCLLSVISAPVGASVAQSTPASNPAAVNAIASLSHDQIHELQDQSQQQTSVAVIRLEVEQTVLGILQLFAPQVPQLGPDIAFLTTAIPAQQAAVNSLQNQTKLLNQLDDVQDQGIILNAEIQNDTALVPILLQGGNVQAANGLQSTIVADQAAVQALQPQIAAVEVEVAAFV